MHKHTASSTSAGVPNTAVGGTSVRENSRAESSSSNPNISSSTRRQTPLVALAVYRPKCEKDSLNGRLGPPDFYPQSPNCPEETLTREYLQSGYKETVEGIEEAKEIALSQAGIFMRPEIFLKAKEALRKRYKAIHESRALKRKAGLVYGVPLTGALLGKSGCFPEQRPSSEEFRARWIQALSQQSKKLRSLSENVPQGFHKKTLIDVLIHYNVPLIRATWFVRITYLNQVWPGSDNPLHSTLEDKPQLARSDRWTNDVIEYLGQLLDELTPPDGAAAASHRGDQSLLGFMSGPVSVKHRNNLEADGRSVEFKWWYMAHLIQWHMLEGLLLPSLLMDWVLSQLQEKTSIEVLEVILPVTIALMDSIILSPAHVNIFMEVCTLHLNDATFGSSTAPVNGKKLCIASTLAEMLRYMIITVPDTFVSVGCFPLPSLVACDTSHNGNSLCCLTGQKFFPLDRQEDHFRRLSFGRVVSFIEKRSSDLSKLANPVIHGRGAAAVVLALDKAVATGNTTLAYTLLFHDLSDPWMERKWMAEVSPCLQHSLMWIETVGLAMVSSIFFLCEWATCNYRDCYTSLPQNLKFSGCKDYSQIYVALQILKKKAGEYFNFSYSKDSSYVLQNHDTNVNSVVRNGTSEAAAMVEHNPNSRSHLKEHPVEKKPKVDMFESPGPVHDIIVCWLDQHEVGKPAGFKHVIVFVMELIRSGLFYPHAYARQLIASGLINKTTVAGDLVRQQRHHKILKEIPGPFLLDVLEEGKVAETEQLLEIVSVYSSERRLVLRELSGHHFMHVDLRTDCSIFSQRKKNSQSALEDVTCGKIRKHVAGVKELISGLLRLPSGSCCSCLVEPQTGALQKGLKRRQTTADLKSCHIKIKSDRPELVMTKKQKLDEVNCYQEIQLIHEDNNDLWWERKGAILEEPFKVEQPQKLTKQASKGRQKVVRKTQSLEELAIARIESSLGTSTSHACDNNLRCVHRSNPENKHFKEIEQRMVFDISDVQRALKKLRMLEKRSVSIWMLKSLRQLIEGSETVKSNSNNLRNVRTSLPDHKTEVEWCLREDDLLSILYIVEMSCDFVSAARFLISLLPKARSTQVSANAMQQKSRECQMCQVGEAFLLSSIQRYENVIVAADFLPEVLSALMQKNPNVLPSNGRNVGSFAFSFAYIRYLVKKYRETPSVEKWEANLRATCDKRLLTELENGRSINGETVSLSGALPGEDIDEAIRQRLCLRTPKIPNLKEVVQRHVEDASSYLFGKERNTISSKSSPLERRGDIYQKAHNIVLGIVDCIRQNGGISPDGDPSVVSSAISSILINSTVSVAKLLDLSNRNCQPNAISMNCARIVLNIHIKVLVLLKEALGEKFVRAFEISLASEASKAMSVACSLLKGHCFQSSADPHEMLENHSSEPVSNSAKSSGARATKIVVVSAFVVGAIVHGVISLERMILALRLKEGLDILRFLRISRVSSNGISAPFDASKMDISTEVNVLWFRLLVGNCRAISDGLVAELLGDTCVLALSRMQRMLPLRLIFPPAYSIFALVFWRRYLPISSMSTYEDIPLHQHLTMSILDIMKHQPFRDVCLRDVHTLYDLLSADVGESELAAMLELRGPDKHVKVMPFFPLRARVFMDTLIDCKMPSYVMQEDVSWAEPRTVSDVEGNLSGRLLHILDALQPAKFHWQWILLRLLLNEQALGEKFDTQGMSAVEMYRSLSPSSEDFELSESEKRFTEIVLSRLLVRPEAASLYSEVAHLLGKSLQKYLVLNVKWVLEGQDVLLGRKSIRQQLLYVAHRKSLSLGVPLGAHYRKPWGWSTSFCSTASVTNKTSKRKYETVSTGDGEVDEGTSTKECSKYISHNVDSDALGSANQHIMENSLVELLLPCIDRSSSELRNAFASELVKEMGILENHIGALTRKSMRQSSVTSLANEGVPSKVSRKGMRGGSPILGRRSSVVSDSNPPSAAALKASLWLRLQFLIRLLPVFYEYREHSPKNLRTALASIILRLLGMRVIYEYADVSYLASNNISTSRKQEGESWLEYSVPALSNHPSESLFDRLLSMLHALLNSYRPRWVKPTTLAKLCADDPEDDDCLELEREATDVFQSELDNMELPPNIRWRIQSALPYPPVSHSSHSYIRSLQASAMLQTGAHGSQQRNISGRNKVGPSQDIDTEVDPWMIFEDGTGAYCGSTGFFPPDHFKACNCLKGAVRVRRTDLTYIGALDDDR